MTTYGAAAIAGFGAGLALATRIGRRDRACHPTFGRGLDESRASATYLAGYIRGFEDCGARTAT
ncbi:hypothetical protein GCM10022255_112860 [Dactylosporangium darangshiense]|uniref:Uncharacterized protein n=1 Tax=Dactylosporangium darangshiense TaxID=579108 RepID=A0ABP8DVN4_9ACTN